MKEDTLLVCRKTGKTGEDSNGDNSNEYLLLAQLSYKLFYLTCTLTGSLSDQFYQVSIANSL